MENQGGYKLDSIAVCANDRVEQGELFVWVKTVEEDGGENAKVIAWIRAI